MTISSGLSEVAPDIKVRTKERTEAHPHPYLRGNFYPVFEETVGDDGIECQVIGTIPESLRGSQYVRTGPNSLNVPEDDAPYHFFEGEGMTVPPTRRSFGELTLHHMSRITNIKTSLIICSICP